MFYSCQIRYHFQTLHFDEISKFKSITEHLKEYLRSPYFVLFSKQIMAKWTSCLPCLHWFLGAMREDLRLGHVQWKYVYSAQLLSLWVQHQKAAVLGKFIWLYLMKEKYKDRRVCQNKRNRGGVPPPPPTVTVSVLRAKTVGFQKDINLSHVSLNLPILGTKSEDQISV